MNDPFPHLPNRLQRIISYLKDRKIHPKLVFFSMGILATTWFLIRVIPKPSRAGYPCMQATAPFMSAFVLYLLSMGASVMAFKSIPSYVARSKYITAFAFLLIAFGFVLFSNTQLPSFSYGSNIANTQNYFTPNEPIGEAQGIFPGRVVWMWNPDATNESCSNTSNLNGVIDSGDDAWFMEANNNQQVIDSMLIKSLNLLTNASDNISAWDKIFKHYNLKNGNGEIGYQNGQKILLKINATTAYGGLATGKYYADLSRNDDNTLNPFAAETNPFLVLSVLSQLVNEAMVPQEMIYVGDPARNIYKELYDLWSASFPNVNYLGNNTIHPEIEIESLGRVPTVVSTDDEVFYSDDGVVMPDAITDKLFTIFDEIDYLINIPTMKAHATAGITLAAKNHFGSFTRTWALHLHSGLMGGIDDPERLGYGLYRIQTDIMMHKLLSGKNLLMIVDGLYPGEDALGVPFKWTSIPFENDWCSSIFLSLDPVAIESVCHDFLRTEYNGEAVSERRPNWHGVDDYLHQAADSTLWPENTTYDPDNDGILIASLGVHEHWNDSLNKAYTRNLEIGDGIELIKAHEIQIGLTEVSDHIDVVVYPNPTTDKIFISNKEKDKLMYTVSDVSGKIILDGRIEGNSELSLELGHLNKGLYLVSLRTATKQQIIKVLKQ